MQLFVSMSQETILKLVSKFRFFNVIFWYESQEGAYVSGGTDQLILTLGTELVE